MYRLSFIIVFIVATLLLNAQSPHGEYIDKKCTNCHNTSGWEIPLDSWNFQEFPKKNKSVATGLELPYQDSTFNHYNTEFPLTGGHQNVDCRTCHPTLIFQEANTDCISCHLDMHKSTVGNDCIRCHSTENWLVDNIPELHEDNGFPLFGVHQGLSCVDCHTSETLSSFERIGNDCINCHTADFEMTNSPNHIEAGFSNQCLDCHTLEEQDWRTDIIDHSFFPLTDGHEIQDCKKCHQTDNYSDVPRDCIGCHMQDYENTSSPDHEILNFNTDCTACHTTLPEWKPAEFIEHDASFFPIYSGAHNEVWSDCVECHSNAQDFTEFTCISCHSNPETDNSHTNVTGYMYEDAACLACHPTGNIEMAFDHQQTDFPLTGSHTDVACLDCHANGYEGTSTNCFDCHALDFEGSINPDHQELNLPTDCASCHTTDPEWYPATFDLHDDFYPLVGEHAAIAANCAVCHNGDYNNTPNDCIGCHQTDYENTSSPDHEQANFGTDCVSCHNEDGWVPSSFDHDADFPIYSGKHLDVWSDCVECHNNPNDFMQFTCIGCHINPDTDDAHVTVGGYIYESNACLVCHPTGDADMTFDHNATDFPLTGAHLDIGCISCHANGYEGTTTNCFDCHTMDFEGSINPNHQELNIPTDCISCHTTEPDWMPATFAIHDDYFVLEGAHAIIANDCASCHNGDYTNTPNTCIACHQMEYDETENPDHQSVNFGTECLDCHNFTAWTPATFDHDAQYFPIYSGSHDGVWNDCIDCHMNNSDFSNVSCINCHLNPETDDAHMAVGGYIYEDNACFACHPTGESDILFDHNMTNFPLDGAHIDVDCISCHSNGFEGTSTNCFDCHTMDFEGSINPDHQQLNIPTDCISCHTTDPDWTPASFAIHDEYYVLEGAHAMIANDCASCHNGDYNNTPNTCIGCHQMEYDETTEPNHEIVNFGTECLDCHNLIDWTPATFDHDAQYFPIYSGSHDGVWNDCMDCHMNSSDFSDVSCINCHLNPEMDDAHQGVGGYVYDDNACFACHPTGESDMVFDHNMTNFPLDGAHVDVDCISCHADGYQGTSTNCVDCHQMDFDGSINPSHIELNIPTDCISCHTTDPDWVPASFAIHDDYYPLNGAHSMIAENCASCHNGDYNNTPNTCIACHQQDFDETTNPNHGQGNFSAECLTCHTEIAWSPSTFDHDPIYPLIGAHADIANDCNQCHSEGYVNTPNTCVGCHQQNYDETTQPDHALAMFPTDCASCHDQTAWIPSTFDHDGQYFPINSGTHDGVWNDCIECHIDPGNFALFTCVGCHTDPQTSNDHAGIGGYVFEDNACLACHPTGETQGSIDHDNTAFPLTGAHIGVECIDCHDQGYAGTTTICNDCHNMDYASSINPNHQALNLSTNCIECHTTDPDWMPAQFAVHDDYYPLTGGHLEIANNCFECHNGDYINTPTDCFSCHSDDHNSSSNPNHVNLNIPTNCVDCHSTNPEWMPATFDIHDAYYPLNGAHATIANDCATCHNGNYNNTPNTCIACHQAEYDATTNPNHSQGNFSSDCLTCHTEIAWSPSTFNHDPIYPLNGAHTAIENDCNQCHSQGYVNTPNTCVGCHLSDYNGTTNPDHASAMFPTDCQSCHSETAWIPSTWDHDGMYFPIYSGKHENEWSLCVECHTTANDFTLFSCIDCHEHNNQNDVDDDHDGVSGYIYESNACYSCHPTGED